MLRLVKKLLGLNYRVYKSGGKLSDYLLLKDMFRFDPVADIDRYLRRYPLDPETLGDMMWEVYRYRHRDKYEALEVLLKHGADPGGYGTSQDNCLLGHVARLGDTECMGWLIDRGAKVNCRYLGASLLTALLEQGKFQSAAYLIKRGADIHYKVDGMTTLEFFNKPEKYNEKVLVFLRHYALRASRM